MAVNGIEHRWRDGIPKVFDTTFEHRTFNEGEGNSRVLLVDFWHPDLGVEEREAMRIFWNYNSGV